MYPYTATNLSTVFSTGEAFKKGEKIYTKDIMGKQTTHDVEGQIRIASLKNAWAGAHSPCVRYAGFTSVFL